MKIEIKNVKINSSFSEETICFKADVYVNGKKTAYAENDGHGGSTFYHAYAPELRSLLEQAETYAKTLPSKTETFGDGDSITIESDLEQIIDNEIYRI